MNKTVVRKILDHPDRDEIVNKLMLDIPESDINEWLAEKYTNVNEAKFVLTEKNIKAFKDNYLDIYRTIQDDMHKTKLAVVNNAEEQLDLAVKNNPAYKSKIMEAVGKEIDVRQMVAHLCAAIEIRVGQVFDEIQNDPRNINTKVDRLLIDYAEVLGTILEKYYKFTENPADQVIQHNVTLQVVDQHVLLVQECIREVLQSLDLESSMLFMDLFTEKMAKLKLPAPESVMNSDTKLAEAKVLSETINKKLNSK
jgi:hypothetical protein